TKAIHSQYGRDDVRIYATATNVDNEQHALKVWHLTCGGGACPKKTGERCRKPRPKPGAAGALRADAAVALGRRLRDREQPPKSLFLGRKFVARVATVRTNADDETLPESAWYSKIGPFLEALS